MTQITQVGQCTIVQGDNLETLRLMPDASVQCCVTSPPYDNLRSYGGYVFDFEGCAKELYRVLEIGGVLCWVVGDSVVKGSETLTSSKQKIFFVEQCGFTMHDTMFYEKLNPGNPSDSQRRYNQSIEYVFILTKGKPRAWNPIKDKPNSSFGKTRYGNKVVKKKDGSVSHEHPRTPAAEFGLRGNCWLGPTAAQEKPCQHLPHPAQMPEWLTGDLVLSWSNVGDTILDICGGAATTGLMANRYSRKSIILELNPEYVAIAAARLQTDLEKQSG